MVKAQNNPQETDRSRLKILPTELICGRLGRLFDPPITPVVRVVFLPEKLANAVTYQNSKENPAAGKSFGSRFVAGAIETKAGGRPSQIKAELVARVVVFQTWLRAQDPAALVNADEGTILSVDHGHYFTGGAWDDGVLKAAPPSVSPESALISGDERRFKDRSVFADALTELVALSDKAVEEACGRIPQEWGVDQDTLTATAHFLLARKRLVEDALSGLWGGAP